MARGGGVSSRGRGKFKVARGGGRHFSRDLDPRRAEPSESESSSEEETSSEEEDDGPSAADIAKLAPEMAAMNIKLGNTEAIEIPEEEEMSRAEKRALKKAQGAKKVAIQEPEDSESESSDEEDAPKPAAKGKAKVAPPPQLSRKEREAADKKAAAERYQKLHAQGKTTEAQSDLARLQEVRRRREAAAAQRLAEAEEAAKEAAAKKDKVSKRN
ncbi:hypothetical protein IAR55_005899 [Kwoniella newhampshirensis]|uniref:Casein kinase substrate phosphoprotein PP28 domain-containing protein n=1 Tax=Kwoniella newhampshirensis TaxID=1651941 RepID=A0AAW0YT44_9TREE